MTDRESIHVEYFSDLLCVWAYASQARVREMLENFGSRVRLQTRYFGVFADTAHKIGRGWSERGGWEGFARHVHEVGEHFGHVELHSELWTRVRPASSTGPHLVLKAVQSIEADGDAPPDSAETLAWQLRLGFFRDGRDIGRWPVLEELVGAAGLPVDRVRAELDSGRAYAALAADERDREAYRLEGSPTFVLNEGRQKLYGNVGYRILEANIRELLREPETGAASWC